MGEGAKRTRGGLAMGGRGLTSAPEGVNARRGLPPGSGQARRARGVSIEKSVRTLRLPLLVSLLATSTLASSAFQMDVTALTRAAADVVRVRVTSSRSAWTDEHRRLVTLVEVEVLERWKGTAATTLTVVQPGGVLDGVGQRVAGVARLVAGEEVVLFLEREGQAHRTVGLSQGVYRVVRASGSGPARAVPAELQGLALVPPPGRVPEPRLSVALEALRDAVRREAAQR